MWNIEATITGTLHCAEHSASSRRPSQSDIKENFEWSSCILNLLGERVTAIRLGNTLILLGKTNLGESTTSNEETSGIRSSPVLEPMVDAILGQFRRVGRGKDNVPLNLGVDDLTNLY